MKESLGDMTRWALERIRYSDHRMTVSDLENDIRKEFQVPRKSSSGVVRSLIASSDIEYLNDFGRTFLVESYSRPVTISHHVILKPPECVVEAPADVVVVDQNKGIAFGRGNHPTTRLCIQAIDSILYGMDPDIKKRMCALDVGTGTGILALVAAAFGIGRVKGCDIDPIARNEAVENIRQNQMGQCIDIQEKIDDHLQYDLILANLRYPTLMDLRFLFKDLLTDDSTMILSGLKKTEEDTIIHAYLEKPGLRLMDKKTEGGWSCLVFKAQKNS
jgi:ribosomal protein L11 methyltransferase